MGRWAVMLSMPIVMLINPICATMMIIIMQSAYQSGGTGAVIAWAIQYYVAVIVGMAAVITYKRRNA